MYSQVQVLHSVYPLEKTIANINIDNTSLYSRTKDAQNAGFGLTSIDTVLRKTAATQGQDLKEEIDKEGVYFRSDQFPFARAGVPAVLLTPGWR